jgi:ATP-dependent helicase/nuclease subunit B
MNRPSAKPMARSAPHIVTIPPGAPFLSVLAEKIHHGGGLIDGLAYQAGRAPFAGARNHFRPHTQSRPRASLRTDGPDWGGVCDPAGRSGPLARPMRTRASSIQPILRPCRLTRRSRKRLQPCGWPIWCSPGKRHCPDAVLDHLGGAPLVAPANPADAIWLGRSLFDLIQAVETEECDFAGLDQVVSEDLQQWWQLTREFLAIAREYWPALLTEISRSSPARHQNAMIDVFTRSLDSADTRR